MAAPQDPFLEAQEDADALLSTAESHATSYLRIRSTASSASSPEVVEARRELASTLEELAADVADLDAAVQAVEGDPYRYGLAVDEVARRRKFVRDLEDDMRRLREIVDSATPLSALSGVSSLPDPRGFDHDGRGGHGHGHGQEREDEANEGEDEDHFAQYEQQRQQELLEQQDEALDGVFRTVGNLRLQADEMGRELEEQGELLDDVDTLADRVGGKLNLGVKRIGTVLRQNEDTWSSCCIATLIFVLIILLVLVLIV